MTEAAAFANPHRFETLCALDFLIYSSHKTGTQTLHRTLNLNGFRSRHCHYLTHLDLNKDDLVAFSKEYFRKNGKNLKVISVFREPVERSIASFFQGYGTRPIRLNAVRSAEETIIHLWPVDQLQKKFLEDMEAKALICYEESIHDMCRQLRMDAASFSFEPDAPFTMTALECIDLYLIRFDNLFKDPLETLSQLVHRRLALHTVNVGSQKWYREKYRLFRSSITIPRPLIQSVYESRRDLVTLFYPGRYEAMLEQALQHFGGNDGSSGGGAESFSETFR